MPTVPTGNKQIGELGVIVTTNVPSTNVLLEQLDTLAVVKNTVGVATAAPPTNKFIGELGVVATTYVPQQTIYVPQLEAFAVVSLAPPPSMMAMQLESFAVVKDRASSATVAPVDNKFIGELSTLVTVSVPASTVLMEQLDAFAVVQYVKPRKELTVLNLEYAANAQFSVGD